MLKKWLIEKGFKFLISAIVLGIGIWYLSSSIGGASLSYTSIDTFMHQLENASSEKSSIPGCFLCGYINDLFAVLGSATEKFWNGIVNNLWIVIAIGFGIFIALHSVQFFRENAKSKDIKDLTNNEPKTDFKKWFDKVWKTGVRVVIISALIGAVNWTGTGALRITTNLVITPVMYLGSELSMATTHIISNGACEMTQTAQTEQDILTPVLNPFMCVIENLNTVMLAGAGGGFALMNYAWLGMGGGVFTWITGLALVLMFLIIGFDLLFKVLTVLFKLIFIIIFMPLLLGAAAFEQVWSLAKDVLKNSINMLIDSAISILKISLKICIVYAIVCFSASEYGFTTILPPLLGNVHEESLTEQSKAVYNVFSSCEKESVINGDIDKTLFKSCFDEKRAVVEAQYPDAFNFMRDGFSFLIFMIGIAFLYFWVISPKIDELLAKDTKETFDYGQWLKDLGKTTANAPYKVYSKVKEVIDKGK
ncbi:MAG: hypothetical protein J6S57_00195 [Alphaproteobacteria bacterium]|nr:hypothetical protein [Alphaproteobacteria bacterium]